MTKRFLFMPPLTAIVALILGGCTQHPVTAIAPMAPASETAAISKASAAVGAAANANAQNPDGLPKTAVASELGVASAALPAPDPKDAAAAQERVNLVLSGKLDEAQKAYAAAQSEAASLRSQIEKERAENAAKLQATIERMEREKVAAVKAAKDEAARAQRRILNAIFHGVGGFLVLAGIGCFTFLSGVPFAGPKVGAGLLAAGLLSIGAGFALNEALSHAWIAWAFLGCGAACVLVVLGLGIANHWWAKQSEAPTQPKPSTGGATT